MLKTTLIPLFLLFLIHGALAQSSPCKDMLGSAYVDYLNHKKEDALKMVDKGIACDTSNWVGYFLKAEMLSDREELNNHHSAVLNKDKFQVAEIYYKIAISKSEGEDQIEALGALISFYQLYGKNEKVVFVSDSLLKEEIPLEHKLNILHDLGRTYIAEGEFERGIEQYQRMIQLDSLNDIAYSAIAYSYIEKQDFSKAFVYANKAYELNNEEQNHLHNVAYCALELKKYEKAIEIYHLKDSLYGKDAYSYNNEANALIHLGRLEEAIEKLNESRIIEPTNSFLYRNYGLYYKKKGNQTLACEYFKLAMDIESNPNFHALMKESYDEHCKCCKIQLDERNLMQELSELVEDPNNDVSLGHKIGFGSFCRMIADQGYPFELSLNPKAKKKDGVSLMVIDLSKCEVEYLFTKELNEIITKEMKKNLTEMFDKYLCEQHQLTKGIGGTIIKIEQVVERLGTN